MTFSEYSVLYKDGQLKLEPAGLFLNDFFTVYFCGASTKDPLLTLGLRVLNTAKHEDDSLAFYNSISAEEGEIVYQLHFNSHVDRKPLPYGVIAACYSSFLEPDRSGAVAKSMREEFNKPEFLDALGELTVRYLRNRFPDAPGYLPLYFVFYGITKACNEAQEPMKEMESALLKSFAKSKKYGVFRCINGVSSTDEHSYMAVYCETVDREAIDLVIGFKLKDLKMRPAKIVRE